MGDRMCRRFAPWLRLQETPLELTVSFLAFAVSILSLIFEWPTLTWAGVLLNITLAIGGAAVVGGRLADDLDAESAGLAWLLAALVLVLLRVLPHAATVEQIVSVVFNYGALVVGFGVRLYVVRRAAKARSRAARIIARREGP